MRLIYGWMGQQGIDRKWKTDEKTGLLQKESYLQQPCFLRGMVFAMAQSAGMGFLAHPTSQAPTQIRTAKILPHSPCFGH